jgi:hypothetical protein
MSLQYEISWNPVQREVIHADGHDKANNVNPATGHDPRPVPLHSSAQFFSRWRSHLARVTVRLRSHCIRIWPIFYTGVHCRHRQKRQMCLNKWKRSQWCRAAVTCTDMFRRLTVETKSFCFFCPCMPVCRVVSYWKHHCLVCIFSIILKKKNVYACSSSIGNKVWNSPHFSLSSKTGFTQSLLSSSNSNIFNKGFSNSSNFNALQTKSR